MRLATRLIGLLAVVPLALAGCGSSGANLPKDIPAPNAEGLVGYLIQAQNACTIGDPARVRDEAQSFRAAVADLPSSVDPSVLTVLRRGADSLKSLARHADGCASGATGASGPSGFVPTTTSTTAEVPSTPTSKPTDAAKPKPKPTPAPNPNPKPAPAPAQPGNAPGHTGAPGQSGGGSGGVGVGPGKAKAAKAAGP